MPIPLRTISRRLSRTETDAGDVSALPDAPGAEYDVRSRKLEWKRHPEKTGRYLNVFIEQNNTCNLKCRMCGFSDSRVASVPRYQIRGALREKCLTPITNEGVARANGEGSILIGVPEGLHDASLTASAPSPPA